MIALSFAVFGCPGSTPVDYSNNRLVYYYESSGGSTATNGLFSYNISTNSTVQYATNAVLFATRPSSDNKVLFQYDSSIQKRLWGKCTDNSLRDVPFPDTVVMSLQYDYVFPPKINISNDGHHAYYMVNLKPFGSTNPVDFTPQLIHYDCANNVMTKIDFKDFVLQSLSNNNINVVEPYGDYILENSDGSAAWFLLKCSNYVNGNSTVIAYILMEYGNAQVSVKYVQTTNLDKPLTLLGGDVVSRQLLLSSNDYIFLLDLATHTITNTTFTKDQFFNIYQFSNTNGKVIYWVSGAIFVAETNNINNGRQILSLVDVNSTYGKPVDFVPNERISISSDGASAVFALPWTEDHTIFDIFYVNTDGSNLKRLVTGVKTGIPYLSDPITQ
jgi:hypothetical protein